jgi:predicted branched-subunit amino acid permease
MSRTPESVAFLDGARDTMSVVPSFLPFGVVCGLASVNAGMPISAALGLPALVFAGSSQAVVTQMIQSAGAVWVAILSGCVVNLRMGVYSAALSSRLRHKTPAQRLLVAAFLIDQNFALLQQRELTHPKDPHLVPYFAGMSTVFWTAWLLFCALGIFAGNIVPASWQLDFAIPLSFVALGVASIRSAPMAVAAVVGGIASVLFFSLPLKLGLIAACLSGLAAGLLTEQGWTRWTSHKPG